MKLIKGIPIVVGLLILALSAGCAVGPQSRGDAIPAAAQTNSDRVRLVEPPLVLQDFTMPASDGRALSLSDLRGQWVILFFGYTHCPDFCPLTLVDYVAVKELLGPAAEAVTFVYVSVDGLRDTPDLMRRYLAHFDPDFIGLSGDDATLVRIHTDYDLYYKRSVVAGGDTYIVDHSTRTYLIDPDGRLRLSFAYSTEPEVMAAVVGDYLQTAAAADIQ